MAGHADVDRFSGIFGVTVTPFSADGTSIDEAGVQRVVDLLLDDGIDRLVPCGNTGEYWTLSIEERRRVVELTAARCAGRAATLVVGAGGTIGEVVAAAEHAARNGADAVMVHHPTHPYPTGEGLVAYWRAIAARSPLPIVPYLKTAIDGDTVRRMADLPAVVAVKWGVNDLPAFARAVAASGGVAGARVRWICGTAELWAPFYWAAGAVGFTSGLVNVAARPALELLAALEAMDRQRTMAIWERIRPFEQLRARQADGINVAVVKEAMRQVGRPSGPIRAPSSEVGPAERVEIAAWLADWGLTSSDATHTGESSSARDSADSAPVTTTSGAAR